jgi:hypothetical protein
MRGAGKAPGGASLPVIALNKRLLAEKDVHLMEKDAHLVAMLAEKDARLVAKDALLLEKAKLEAAYARELAVALHVADVARGIVGSRAELWLTGKLPTTAMEPSAVEPTLVVISQLSLSLRTVTR